MEFYALKTAACWAILYGFYKLVLERESMHHLKRWYLLGGLVLGAIIPLITFTSYVLVDGEAVIYMVRGENGAELAQQSFWQSLNYSKILWTVYWIGFGLFAMRFLWNLSKLIRSIWAHPKSAKKPLFFVLLGRPVQPHTFLQYIFVNKKRFTAQAIPEEVLLHEQAHAEQLHSVDVLLAELMQVVFWFNPLVYFIKHSILLNHEFLADQAVLKTGVPKSQYQNTLLAYLNPRTCPELASAINYSSIKKRFTLMKNSSSKKTQWAKGLLLLPLLAVLLYSFSSTNEVLIEEKIPVEEIADQSQKTTKEAYLPVKHPTLDDFERWQDSDQYGLWIDGKRVANKEIFEYHPDDLPYFTESKLAKNAVNYGKHYVQVDVMSNSYWQDQKGIGFIPEEMKEFLIDQAVNGDKELQISIQGKSVYVNGVKTSLKQFKAVVNEATKDWSQSDFNRVDLELMIKNPNKDFINKLNDIFKETDLYKADPSKFPYGLNPPPPPPPPPAPPAPVVEEVEIEIRDAQNVQYVIVEKDEVEEVEEELEEIIEVENVQTKVKRKAYINGGDPDEEVIIIEVVEDPDSLTPPPPPPPKEPIEAIKDLIDQGATFYLDGKKISSSQALELVKADKINYIDVEKVDNNPPKVLMKQ
ncbi:M56 family metallopeptidase [Gilvibacter sediminis]|uniref:M56 family metallopeptidase n=1 Tax=Gilvibacter sediminis TaxID=379071 RepID=UPI00234FC006|nr:M56 family metallopeptidase [Gilvibacter sediminis]MDC7997307.1 M56 family metallopeptidase [Gilvibacter sediminis]